LYEHGHAHREQRMRYLCCSPCCASVCALLYAMCRVLESRSRQQAYPCECRRDVRSQWLAAHVSLHRERAEYSYAEHSGKCGASQWSSSGTVAAAFAHAVAAAAAPARVPAQQRGGGRSREQSHQQAAREKKSSRSRQALVAVLSVMHSCSFHRTHSTGKCRVSVSNKCRLEGLERAHGKHQQQRTGWQVQC